MSKTHPRSQPSLLSIRAFEAAGRLNSFTLAAQELGLTQSAISRHIRSLEERFGQGLFHRNGRHIALTGMGASYLGELSVGLECIREANARMAENVRPKNRVTISMLPSVAALWLAPRLHEFADRYPDIDLRIHASRSLVDFERDEIDLAIRYGLGRWAGSRSEIFVEETLIPVCSPEIARRYELEKSLDNLLRVPLLLDDIPDGWDAWLRSVGLDPAKAKYGAAFDEGSALYGAAMADAGIALGRGVLVRNHLQQGRLVAPIERSIQASFSYWLVWPLKAFPTPASLKLADWLRRCVAEPPCPAPAPSLSPPPGTRSSAG